MSGTNLVDGLLDRGAMDQAVVDEEQKRRPLHVEVGIGDVSASDDEEQ